LISRFSLNASLASALKRSSWKIEDYRKFVKDYKNARGREEKQGLQAMIDQIKKDFRTEINRDNPKQKKLNKLSNELYTKYTGNKLFEEQLTKKQKQDRARLEKEITKLQKEIDDLKNNEIYRNAFEWRFEFPEVLDDEGNFMGFDVVIGNPPYIRQEGIKNIKEYLKQNYKVFSSTADILTYFIELGMGILKKEGIINLIISNKFLRANYGEKLRAWLKKYQILNIIDFGDLSVFEEASTYPLIISTKKSYTNTRINVTIIDNLNFHDLSEYIEENKYYVKNETLSKSNWNLIDEHSFKLIKNIKYHSITLKDYIGNNPIFYGIKTGNNNAFVIDEKKKDELISLDPNSEKLIKPCYKGRDIKKWVSNKPNQYLILITRGTEIDKFPAIKEHLSQFKEKLRKKAGNSKWFELQASPSDLQKFEKVKLITPDISKSAKFSIDIEGDNYGLNTVYFINSNDKFILALLNSKLIEFYYKSIMSQYRGGYLRFFAQYLETIPIIKNPSKQNKEIIISLVDQILQQKQQDPAADTSALEAEIDRMIYELYGLTEEEVRIVEGGV